jgi:hypothetical protein
MAERTSYDDSLAAALESDPLPPDAVASGAEGLPLVPSGSLSPTTSSPPAGVLQTAASSDNDEHPSAVPSRATQQPPTSGDGVHAPEHRDHFTPGYFARPQLARAHALILFNVGIL